MLEYYSVNLGKEINDIEKVNKFDYDYSKVYFLSDINYEFDNGKGDEKLVFAFDCSNLLNKKIKFLIKLSILIKKLRKKLEHLLEL